MLSYRPRTPPSSGISSDRPLTPPSSSLDGADEHPLNPDKKKDSQGYVPHIFDLVYPSREAARLTTKHIPAIFLQAEAIDSSVLLGNGASFTASLQKIPEGPKTIEFTTVNVGWSVTKSMPATPRPKYVVYKVARVAFKEDGEPFPEYRRALQSVLTEFHALVYPSLFHHANIIDFLGFAWGSNPFSPAHKLPAIVEEYAEHGTLADLLNKNRMLDFSVKHMLCLDVTRGIVALHGAGIVHGDVKAENVLVCSGPNRKYVAKIADFGFSIIEATETAEVWIGGTNPWRAPETKSAIEVKRLNDTDTYSLGLLIWLVCVDGRWPFDYLIPSTVQGAARYAEIEDLKRGNKLLAATTAKGWLMSWLKETSGSHINQMPKTASAGIADQQRYSEAELRNILFEKLYTQMCQMTLIKSLDDIFENSLQADPGSRHLDVVLLLLESGAEDFAGVEIISEASADRDPSPETKLKFTIKNTSDVEKHFVYNTSDESSKLMRVGASDGSTDREGSASTSTSHTSADNQASKSQSMTENKHPSTPQVKVGGPLVHAAGKTDAKKVGPLPSNALNKAENVAEVSRPPSLPSWTVRGYKHRWFSWQKMRTLDPGDQNLIFDSFRGGDVSEEFMLCSFLLNGYGCKTDVTEALKRLKEVAEKGHHLSRAYIYRIFSACGPSDLNKMPGYEYLYDYAIAGSRPAFQELQKSYPAEKVEDAHRFLTDAYAGVGAPWFDSSEMLNGYTQSQWINDGWLLDQVKKVEDPSRLVVNKRGDSVLHFVAACGRWKPFKSLIADYKMDINRVNPQGETPLLCACRSGHGGIAIICLQTYKADASIAAKNGETPLHWLVSFVDQYVQPLANDLIANGAKVDATTHERISHSKFPGNIDVDFQMPGTALGWAVHNNRPQIVRLLLEHGADPHWAHAKGEMSPLKWAAYYHHDQCLRNIIEHLEGKVTAVTSDGKIDKRKTLFFGPVIKEAIHASDRFSMILRNGSEYLNRLDATLDLLREKTVYVNTQSTFHGNMLYFAVSEAHDAVVEYMFKHDWRVETLNNPCVPAQRTPVLEAIRWNRRPLIELLLQHGADTKALAANPFQPVTRNWSALHVFAQEGHHKDISIVETLIQLGVPVDGPMASSQMEDKSISDNDIASEMSTLSVTDKPTPVLPCETPFAVAIRRNAFNLASTLLSLGANPNALTISSGLFKSPHRLTILGHIIISNARYSSARLKYLLRLIEVEKVNLIVEPARQLTALHRAAMAYQDVASVITGEKLKMEEFDMETNRDIMYELLLHWPASEELNATCHIRGNTALQLAVESGNVGAIESLLKAGADATIVNEDGETALQVAERLAGQSKMHEELVLRLRLGGNVMNFLGGSRQVLGSSGERVS